MNTTTMMITRNISTKTRRVVNIIIMMRKKMIMTMITTRNISTRASMMMTTIMMMITRIVITNIRVRKVVSVITTMMTTMIITMMTTMIITMMITTRMITSMIRMTTQVFFIRSMDIAGTDVFMLDHLLLFRFTVVLLAYPTIVYSTVLVGLDQPSVIDPMASSVIR